MSFFAELRRRNVFRVGAAYVVTAWLLIQVAETIFPLFGFDETPARVVVIALAVGFLPALVFAWAFEITPEGLKRESEFARDPSISPQTGKKLDRIIMVVLALALGYFAFDKFVLAPERETAEQEQQAEQLATATEEARREGRIEALVDSYGDKSIAVLPFVNMSDDPGNEYFSDGISEELLNLLAQIPELRVISRSSAFSYKGKDVKLSQVAMDLDVDHILEGSVRKSGNRVRITVQLIEARSDTHLWSETYDRTLDDIFAVQDEISGEVVSQLKVKLLGDRPQVAETDPKAYTLYLQARDLINHQGDDTIAEAQALLEAALAIDPEYVPAINEMSRSYIVMDTPDEATMEHARQRVRELTQRALSIDPDNGFATIMAGWPDGGAVNNLEVVAQHLQRGLELNPTDLDSLRVAGIVYTWVGRPERAVTILSYVTARDPLCVVCAYALIQNYVALGRLDEAEESMERFRLLTGGSGGLLTLATISVLRGRPDEALVRVDEAAKLSVDNPSGYSQAGLLQAKSLALHDLGRQAEFEETLATLRDGYASTDPEVVASVYAWTGDADAAFELLRTVAGKPPQGFNGWNKNPLFRNLHSDPRWQEMLDSIAHITERMQKIELEVRLPT